MNFQWPNSSIEIFIYAIGLDESQNMIPYMGEIELQLLEPQLNVTDSRGGSYNYTDGMNITMTISHNETILYELSPDHCA